MEQLTDEDKRLIYCVMKKFSYYRNKEDLFQVGWIGLNEAYRNYDPSKNTKFSTYAYTYIFGQMSRLVREDKGIKISRDISKLNLKIEKATILLSQRLMRQPSTYEIASFLEIDEFIVIEAMNSCNVMLDVDELSLGYTNNMEDNVYLQFELDRLSSDELAIIKNRYMNDYTQSETANELGMSQVQVSRKEKKVLQKLKDRFVA